MTQTRTKVFSVLQRVGQSLMIPVSVLPAAGLMVALGRMVLNATEGPGGQVTNAFAHGLGKVLFSGGLAIFEQLPVVFAVGVAIGFTGGAGVAGLAAVAGYFTLANVLKVVGEERGLAMAVNTGVFGGIATGLLTSWLYNRFHTTKLHPVFGFFSGKRLVPIVAVGASILLGLVLAFVWPPIQGGIRSFGEWVMGSEFGPAFYAAGKRLLIPVGLHHVYYPPFLFEFGEFVTTAGQTLKGESARYFAGDPTAGRFMASEYPLMLFALPAAALAIVLRAPKEKRKAVGGVMLSAALTSIITGITEPIEFAFIFVAPALFVFHVIAAFAGGFLTGMFDIHLGYTFSASLIDFALGYFNQKNASMLWLVVGPVMAVVYFSVFYWAIGKFNYMTPGRDEEDSSESETKVQASQRSREVLIALGGAANVKTVDACITRLRLSVVDATKVQTARFKELGASGVLTAGGGNFQIVFGVESEFLKEEIKVLMKEGAGALNSLLTPIAGRVVNLDEVPDETFAKRILGDGIAIDPTEGVVVAPASGTIAQVFRTNHALGLVTDTGLELLIHVGIDTVKMEGRGFKSFVKAGDRVKAGDKLIEFDLALVKKEAKSAISPIIVTNGAILKGLTPTGLKVVAKQEQLLTYSV